MSCLVLSCIPLSCLVFLCLVLFLLFFSSSLLLFSFVALRSYTPLSLHTLFIRIIYLLLSTYLTFTHLVSPSSHYISIFCLYTISIVSFSSHLIAFHLISHHRDLSYHSLHYFSVYSIYLIYILKK